MAAAKRKPRSAATDDGRAGVEPSVRTFTTWTPALLRSAEIQADNGNLRAASNLVDWILADDRVQGTLHTRVQSLLGLDPTFEASGDKRRSSRVVNALEAKEDWWASYPEDELALMVSWGIMLGVVPMRHRWLAVPGHGNRILPLPTFWHPQHLRKDSTTREWLIKVQQGNTGGITEEVLTPGDGEWLLHTPYGGHRPWSLGLWRGLARWVLLKYYAMGDWAAASAKGSLMVATSDTENAPTPKDGYKRTTKAQRSQLAQDIYERGRDGVAVLPPGFDLKLVQTVANSESIYKAQIQMADTAIAIAVRGGNLTTEVQAGSRAAAEAQERLGDDVKRRFDGQSTTTTLHDQSLGWWAKFNFGDAMLAPWPVYPTGPKRDVIGKANSISTASNACEKLLELGFELESDGQGFIDEFELNGIVRAPVGGPRLPAKVKTAPIQDPTLVG